jgi:CheY-like chemotaxis protein
MPHTLLVADDSVTIQRLVQLTFAGHGINVVGASDGQQAIDYLSSNRPDGVLASATLGRRDGFEVARFVRSDPRLRTVPVLLMAGAFDNIDDQRVRDAGAAGVLIKPFEPAHVITRVKELLGVRTPVTHREPAPPPPSQAHTPREEIVVDGGQHLDEWFTESATPDASGPSSGPIPAGWSQVPPAGTAATVAAAFGPADAFAVLLAEEQGEVAPPIVPQPVVELSEDMVERIADRVAERLIQSAFGESLRGTVHDVSERLVRQEIERIRAAAQAQPR